MKHVSILTIALLWIYAAGCGAGSGDAAGTASIGTESTAASEDDASSGASSGASGDETAVATSLHSDDGSTGTSGGMDDGDSSGSDDGGTPPAVGECGVDAWIGVPEPPFGLHDTVDLYTGRAGYTQGPDGPYTHWVDNGAANCSDNSDGTPDQPRCSIPTSIAAGSVVEVHGGPYLLTQQAQDFQIDGTELAPAWLRGIGAPLIDAGGGNNRHWAMAGSYFVVEGLTFVGGATIRFNADHYALRNSEVDFGERNCVNAGGAFGVLYNNDLHHCHRQPGSADTHGVMVGIGASNIWVVGNDIHHNFGNGIQWGNAAQSNPPDFVYIAGNTVHQDRETGVASKWSGNSVISCNTVYDYAASPNGVEWCADDGSYCNTPSSGSAGQAIIQGADGFPAAEWVLYNRIYDVASCFRLEEATRANYVGNVCHDTTDFGIRFEKLGHDTHFLHNTLYNIGTNGNGAALQQDWRDSFSGMRFENNIFHTMGGMMLWFEDFSVVTPTMTYNNNAHYNGGMPLLLDWRGMRSVGSLEELQAVMASDTLNWSGNLVGDPQLVDTSDLDFRPAPASPVIGAGTDLLTTLDQEFKATFGDEVTIIPACWADGAFDIGALCAD